MKLTLCWMTLFGSSLGACELSNYDQQGLVDIMREQFLIEFEEGKIRNLSDSDSQCKSIGSFTAINFNFEKVFILDSRRAFYRWSVSHIPVRGNADAALRQFATAYIATSRYSLAQEFGRDALSSEDRASLDKLTQSSHIWSPFHLKSQLHSVKKGVPVSPESSEEILSMVYRSINGYFLSDFQSPSVALPITKQCSTITSTSSICDCDVYIGHGESKLHWGKLKVPINPGRFPYVGWPTMFPLKQQ
jgi:hypothetical protein